MPISKITAQEAASLVCNGDTLGVGGFGPAGAPKCITPEIARRARTEHEAGRPFKVNVVTGASIGASCDHVDHFETQMPYAVTVAAVCGVAFLIAGWVTSPVMLAAALVALTVVVFILHRISAARLGQVKTSGGEQVKA